MNDKDGWTFTGISSPNYSQMPNELYDEIQPRISPFAFSIVSAIFREYFGWHETAPKPISLSELIEKTGLTRPTVVKYLKEAEEKSVIVCIRGDRRTKNSYAPHMKVVNGVNHLPGEVVNGVNHPSKRRELDLVNGVNSLKEIKETPKQQQIEVRPEDTLQWRMLAAEQISTKVKRAVLDKRYSDNYVIGMILQTYAKYTNGARVDDLRGQLANALRDGDGVDEPYASLAALPAEAWTELILCARAANTHHAQPPVKYLSPPARAAWPEWARCFTAGEHANREGEHFAPLLKGVPAHLREPGLRADVDEWLAARRAAQQEQVA